jgi:hypothetical protein
LLELAAGHHSWPFSFQSPSDCPLSFYDSNVEVAYTLTAVFDSPSIPNAMGTIVHHIIACKQNKGQVQRQIERGSDNIIGVNERLLSTQKQLPMVRRGTLAAFFGSVGFSAESRFLTLLSRSGPAVFPFVTSSSELTVQCTLCGFKASRPEKICLQSGTYNYLC